MSEASLVGIIDQPITNQPACIEINAGGTVFVTLKETLLNAGGIFPHMLEHADMWPKDSQGRLFIDRDPNRFRILLNWLRNIGQPFRCRIAEDMTHELEHFGLFADLLYEKGPGMLVHVQGVGLRPIQSITLTEVVVDNETFLHTQYNGYMLQRPA
jgi:hypothetical protein